MNRALFVFEGIEIIPRLPGPALADAGPNARPGRGTQCKTKARGPSEQWFYDVIMFSQPC